MSFSLNQLIHTFPHYSYNADEVWTCRRRHVRVLPACGAEFLTLPSTQLHHCLATYLPAFKLNANIRKSLLSRIVCLLLTPRAGHMMPHIFKCFQTKCFKQVPDSDKSFNDTVRRREIETGFSQSAGRVFIFFFVFQARWAGQFLV